MSDQEMDGVTTRQPRSHASHNSPAGYLLRRSDSDPTKFHRRWFRLEWREAEVITNVERLTNPGRQPAEEGWVLLATRRPPPVENTLDLKPEIEAHERAVAHQTARRKTGQIAPA